MQGVLGCRHRSSFALGSWFLRKRLLGEGRYCRPSALVRLLSRSLMRLLRLQMVSSDLVVIGPVLRISDVSALQRPYLQALPMSTAPPSLVNH